MDGFSALFKLGMKKRIKDSFIISYGIIFPLFMITILGYMASNYYSGDNGVTSYYYYSMVIIPFCTLLVSITLIYVAGEEREAKCGERFIIAPVSKLAIVMAKILPSTISVALYNLILMIFCKFIFKVDYKGSFFKIYILLVILGFMSCAVGTFIGLATKDFMAIKNFVSTPILLMAMLGGAFFPIGSLGRLVEYISYISPLTWVNKGIFMMLNDNKIDIYIVAILITFILGMIFMYASVKKFKKEAFL